MNKKLLYKIIIAIGCLLAITTFTYFYIKNESPIYIFDYSGYFENYKMMGRLLFSDLKSFLNTLILSIRSYDYNYSSVVLLMPFYKLIGDSRFAYILSLTIMYVFPCILLITHCIMNIIREHNEISQKEELIYFAFTMILVFTYTRLWSPTLRGLSDIIGLLPIILAFLLIKKHNFINKQKVIFPIILGVLVYLPFLFRRWYIYFIIGFYLSMFIIDLLELKKTEKDKKKEIFFNAFKNYFLAGCTTIIMALLIQLPLIKSILNENYSETYNGYQVSLLSHFQNFWNEFGFILIILALVAIILAIFRKKYKKETLFCVLNTAIFWFAFGQVQNMGVHHYLGISFWIILLVMLGIRQIYEVLPKYKNIYLIIILVIFSVNFTTTFIFRDKHIPIISQNNKYYKLKYYNFNELKRLITNIEEILKDPPEENAENPKISVLADSEVISDNLIDLLGNVTIKDNIVYATHIDSRDGINFNSLFTKYIVVTSVSQLGTNANGQYVIDVPNKMIYQNKGIGKAYKFFSGPYLLDNGVEAYIYEKERDFTKEEVEEYLNELFKIYPNWQDKYTYFDKVLLESDVYLGNNWGAFKRMDDNTYFMYPGTNSTKITIPISNNLKSIKLKFYIDYHGNSVTAGKVNVKIYENKNSLYEKEISYLKEEYASLDLNGINNLTFEIDSGETLDNDWLLMDILEIKE